MANSTEIKRQFLHSLKRGTGEAYLIAKNNPEIDFSNQIIKGALNIFAYDGQSEGDRAIYIFDIISVSKQKDKIRKAILQGLLTEQNDTWNLTHLFALAELYAQQNDTEAKQAIYNKFLNNPLRYSDWAGVDEILKLDGLNGLFFVAEEFGKRLKQNPDDWQDDLIISSFQAENKQIKVYDELKRKAKTNKFIRIYLDAIEKTQKRRENYSPEPTKQKDIIDEILNSNPLHPFKGVFSLTEEEINQIAQQLICETNNSNIERFLNIFRFHKFPFESQLILNFAKQKRTSKNQIVENATEALEFLSSKDIRNFAIDKIHSTKNPMSYLAILVSNYQNDDYKLLSEIANKTNNEDKIEQLAVIYTKIYTTNETKECKEPLEILYNKMNCAIHRNEIVRILIKNEVLSDKIKDEIKFDCDLKTRKL